VSEFNISVIIPCFNSENTILRALESVQNQTFRPFEIIVIDDGSSDFTVHLIRKYTSDVTIHLLCNQSNSGPSYSRNIGIMTAKGNWVAFLDSDDFWHPRKLEIQITILKKTGQKIIGGVAITHDCDNFQFKLKDIKTRNIHSINMLWKNYFQTPTVLTLRDEDLFFDQTMSHAEDFDLWTKLLKKHGNGVYMTPCLTFLGKDPYISKGLSSSLIKMELGELKVLLREENMFLRIAAVSFSIFKFMRRILIRKIRYFFKDRTFFFDNF
jgi:glycosyltransferase involved in cell wall biosynthesis